eukprot:Sspe_Gene.96239::Locus_68823_Transcript_1_1_Confidence_1.000_Length_1824::g.96239::m.96239
MAVLVVDGLWWKEEVLVIAYVDNAAGEGPPDPPERPALDEEADSGWGEWLVWQAWGMVPVVGPATHMLYEFNKGNYTVASINAAFLAYDVVTWGGASLARGAEKGVAEGLSKQTTKIAAEKAAAKAALSSAEMTLKEAAEQGAKQIAEQSSKLAAQEASLKAAKKLAKDTVKAGQRKFLIVGPKQAAKKVAKKIIKDESMKLAAQQTATAAVKELSEATMKQASAALAQAAARESAARAAFEAATRRAAQVAAEQAAAKQAFEASLKSGLWGKVAQLFSFGLTSSSHGMHELMAVSQRVDFAHLPGVHPSPAMTNDETYGIAQVRHIPLRTLGESNFLRFYDYCNNGREQPLTKDMVTAPMAPVIRREFEECLRRSQGKLRQAAVRLWTGNTNHTYYKAVQAALISDNGGLLDHWVPFIRLLNNWLMTFPLAHPRATKRKSHMSKDKARSIPLGATYRVGMYCSSSFDKSWDDPAFNGLGGADVRWVFYIPAGCMNAADVSGISIFSENEVLLLPYTPIEIMHREVDVEEGVVTLYASVFRDGRHMDLNLPTLLV